jgi:hypothetical protein
VPSIFKGHSFALQHRGNLGDGVHAHDVGDVQFDIELPLQRQNQVQLLERIPVADVVLMQVWLDLGRAASEDVGQDLCELLIDVRLRNA